MSDSIRRYFQSGCLAVWGAVALSFCLSGRVDSYLHPDFHGWTIASGVVLLLMAAGLLFFPLPVEEEEGGCCASECGGAHAPKSALGVVFTSALLVVPLLVTVQVSPSQFGAVAVMNRGLADSIADLPGYEPLREPPLPTLDGSVDDSGEMMDTGAYLIRNKAGQIQTSTIDLLYAAHEPTMRADFENQDVELIGQFFPAKKNNPSGDRFSLIRMFIMCCAADARPVAVNVQTSKPESFPEMSWVKVTGKATFPTEGGQKVPVILADSVEATETPPETFIY